MNRHDKLVNSDNVTGPAHLMMSSVLTPASKPAYNMDWEYAVPKTHVTSALKVIQKVLLEHKASLPLAGVFIRFAPSFDRSLLSAASPGGYFPQGVPVALLEFAVYRPIGFSKEQEAEYFKPYHELAKILITQFHARAHWGKNEDWIFDLEKQTGSFGEKLSRFKKVAHELDPYGVFSNDFSKTIGL
jgi:hypothetical protein